MSKIRKLTRNQLLAKKVIKEGLYIILGCALMAAGTSFFLLPNQLSSGGFAGISTIIYYLFNLPLGTTMLILNIPLIIFGNIESNSKSIGKRGRAVIGITDSGLADKIQKLIIGGEA